MRNEYDSKAVTELLRNVNSVQDLIQVLSFSNESEKQAAAVPGVAIALDRLITPIVEFIEWAEKIIPDISKKETMIAYVDRETGKKMGEMRVISV